MEAVSAPKLILCFHEHLGAGVKDKAFEEQYSGRIKPILSCLNENPEIPAALHFSGTLLEWLERKKPECLLLIGDLVSRKQVEPLGGGYYEPILPILPPSDKIGQIELLSICLRRLFGKRPQGCFLPFMIWEQSLTGALHTSGMGYTFLSEEQFRAAGIAEEELRWPRLAEDQGKLVTVIPALSALPDLAAHSPPCRLAAFFPRFTRDEPSPSHPAAETEGEVRRFFDGIKRGLTEKRFELSLPGKALRQTGPLQRAYFPNSADAAFLGGEGICTQPRGFLARHRGANSLYAKMLFTNTLIHQLRGDKQRKKNAQEELWKAQDADAFRPAGNACSAARRQAWKALLQAERVTRDKTNFSPALLVFDLDLDGQNECLFQDKNANFYIRPAGAAIFEMDYLPKGWNYLAADGGAFSDWLLSRETDAEKLRAGPRRGTSHSGYAVEERYCGDELYDFTVDRGRAGAVFRLAPREGVPFGGVEIEKRYTLEEGDLSLSYILTNRGKALDFDFIPRIELAFTSRYTVAAPHPAGKAEPARLFTQGPDAPAAVGIRDFEAIDAKNTAAGLSSDTAFDLWFFGGAKDTEGGEPAVFLPRFRVQLEAGASWRAALRLSVNPAKTRHNP
jgi:hypothetical protein